MEEEMLLLPKKYSKSNYKLVSLTNYADSITIRFDSWKWEIRWKVFRYELKLPNGKYMVFHQDEIHRVANKILELQLSSRDVKIETLRIHQPFASFDVFRSVKINNMDMCVSYAYHPGSLLTLSENMFKGFHLINELTNRSELMEDVMKLKIDHFWGVVPDPSMFIRELSFKKWRLKDPRKSSKRDSNFMEIVQGMLDAKPPIGCSVLVHVSDIIYFFDEVDSKLPEMEKITHAGRVYRFIALENADLVILTPARFYTEDPGHVIIKVDDGRIRKFGLIQRFFFRYVDVLAWLLKMFDSAMAILKKKYPNLPTESLCSIYDMLIREHHINIYLIGLFILTCYISFWLLFYDLTDLEIIWALSCFLAYIPTLPVVMLLWRYSISYYDEPPPSIYSRI